MSSLFNKIGAASQRLFNKAVNTPNLLRKIDNTVGRVSNFVSNTANSFGQPAIAGLADKFAKGTHTIRNNLEKAINTPNNEIQSKYA